MNNTQSFYILPSDYKAIIKALEMANKTLNLDLSGRVKKVTTNNFLMALFEAISNSIHAIEDLNTNNGKIVIEVIRNPRQQNLLARDEKPITGFKISDNGIGFDTQNMKSFGIADTTFKAGKGAKGIGRISWLKFFEKAEISSTYNENGKVFRREFGFSISGIDEKEPVGISGSHPNETQILISPIIMSFEEKSYKSLDEIAIAIIDHFIAFLVTNSMPSVIIKDGAAMLNINNLYENSIGKTAQTKTFIIGSEKFTTVSIRTYLGTATHSIFLCGNKRVANRVNLGKKDPFFAKRFHDSSLKEYAYYSFIESEYLNTIVNDDRDGFKFPEPENDSYSTLLHPITKEDILQKAISFAHEELADEIKEKKSENIQTVQNFVTESAPQYRNILKNHGEEISKIHDTDPVKIDISLRKIQFEEEIKTKNDVAMLLKKANENSEDSLKVWQEKSKEVLFRLNENGKANLANYIVQRKMILDLLKKHMEINIDKFAKEQAIHELIFPMRTTSDEISYENQNLWIIDERLAYHYYLASDKPLSTIPPAESDSRKEPDVIIFNRPIAFNNKPEYERIESIVIVEFKRPGESAVNGDKNPVDQILEYIELIQDGRAENRKGRKIDAPKDAYFYGYVICEIDDNLKRTLSRRSMKPTPDGRGMFGYFEDHKAYIEVISYEKMVDDAAKSNRILFEKLQLPIY